MSRVVRYIFVNNVVIVLFVLFGLDQGSGGVGDHGRVRRYLAFQNVTHFFIRMNIKANMVPWNQIFAQGVGFRMNWDDPPDSFRFHKLYRRSLLNHAEDLLDRHGITGFQCIRRAMCETNSIEKPTGIYHRILKIIFRNLQSTSKWLAVSRDECDASVQACPFSMLDVSLYTDV